MTLSQSSSCLNLVVPKLATQVQVRWLWSRKGSVGTESDPIRVNTPAALWRFASHLRNIINRESFCPPLSYSGSWRINPLLSDAIQCVGVHADEDRAGTPVPHVWSANHHHRWDSLSGTTPMFLLRVRAGPPQVAPVPLDWNSLAELSTKTVVMQALHTHLVDHCDWEGLCAWYNVGNEIRRVRRTAFRTRPVTKRELDRLRSQLDRIMDQTNRLSPRTERWRKLRLAIHSGMEQLDDRMSPMWDSALICSLLPGELWDIVLEHLLHLDPISAHTQHNETLLSVLCLLSRSWSRKWRPLLFRSLRLKSYADILFLHRILCSRLSGWLSTYIEHVEVSLENVVSSAGASTMLFSRLPSLKTLIYTFSDRSVTTETMHFRHSFPLTLRLGAANLRSLTTLKLSNRVFTSITTFLSYISVLPSLSRLYPSSALAGAFVPDTVSRFHLAPRSSTQ